MNEQTPPPPGDQPNPGPEGQPDPAPQPDVIDQPAEEISKDARTMAMLAHLSALAGYFIPLGNVIGPLIVWLIKKDEMPFVDDQGKEALNFQITVTIALLLCVIVGVATCGVGFVLTGPLMIAIGIVALVFTIIAAVKANEGVAYRYPMNYKFIK